AGSAQDRGPQAKRHEADGRTRRTGRRRRILGIGCSAIRDRGNAPGRRRLSVLGHLNARIRIRVQIAEIRSMVELISRSGTPEKDKSDRAGSVGVAPRLYE